MIVPTLRVMIVPTLHVMIVPTLRVGMQPVTLCVTTVPGSAQAVRLERGAFREAFPRRALERSVGD
jgi:hypothetical protein